MKSFILFLSISLSLVAELKKSGDYVIDKTNNMMWQDTKANITVLVSHLNSSKYCSELRLGGYTNWEVPSVEDYENIIDKTRKDEIMISRSFKYIVQDDYWTSNRTWRNFGRWGYYIFFKSGTAYYENRTYPKYIRCVRDMK
ncbi:MAG: DUF1566 domain-containing protein [Campylobacterota bacterium]|nr:DUF1566 domain-containing protein [Campylobacterota bacterium]